MAVFAMPRARALDSNVNAMSGAKLYFYSPGTSTEKAVYSDADLTTPISQPVTADSAGNFATIYTGGEYKVVLKTSGDATVWTQDNVNWGDTSATLSPIDFGAAGDGVTDDTAELQAVIDAAGAQATIDGNYTTIDLGGKVYAISSALTFDGYSNVVLANGGLKAIGTWTSTNPMLDVTHTGVYQEAEGIGFRDLMIQCSQKCGGIYFENFFRCHVENCYIVGYPSYGIKTINTQDTNIKNGDLALRRVRCEQFQSGVETATTYTGIGFWIRTADWSMQNCKASKNLINVKFQNMSNGQVLGCHFFNGLTTMGTVSATANNGSGKVRITTSAAHGLATGDFVSVSGIVGTTEANDDWIVTVINTTQFDLNDCTYASAWVSGGTVKYPRPNVWIDEDVNNVMFVGNYIDTTDVITRSMNCVFVGNMFIAGDPELVMVATEASENARDTVIVGNQFARNPLFRVEGVGTWTGYALSAVGNSKTGGGQASGIGRIALDGGSSTAPSIVFGLETTTGTFGNDWNTGIYQPATDQVAICTSGLKRFQVDEDGNVTIGTAQLANTATDGFWYLPGTTSGPPTGVPTAYAGRHPVVFDDTAMRLYIHDGSAWQDASRTAIQVVNMGGDGTTTTINDDARTFWTSDTATRATATINFPTNPRDGQHLSICHRGIITTLTLSGNGATLLGTVPTTAAANSSTTWIYTSSGSQDHWMRVV